MKKYKISIEKPWIGYGGSTIQQNHGEQIKKGYLVWDINNKNDWDVEFKKLINLAPYVTLEWAGNVEKTLMAFEELHGQYAYMPGTRYRICSNVLIPQIQIKEIVDILKNKHKAAEVTFKTDVISNMESINAHGLNLNKRSLSQDPDSTIKLYEKFIQAHPDVYDLRQEDLQIAHETIKTYYYKMNSKTNSEFLEVKNTQWSIKEFKFNNLFSYGEGNYINFENLQNIVGIFGRNAMGKSAIIGALMYVLFNSTDRGSIKNALIVNKNKKECSGSIKINVCGQDYVIERKTIKTSKDDDEKSSTSVNLWLVENRNGQSIKVSKNGITRDDTDKIIRNLIGTSEDFLLTALASQNDLHRFIENKATKRKEMLNRFLELDVFDRLYEFARNDYSSLDNLSKNYSNKDWFRLIEKTENEILKLENDLKSYDEKLFLLNEKKDSLNLWIKTHENEAKNTDNDSIEELKKHVDISKLELLNTVNALTNHEKQIRQHKKDISFFNNILKKIDINSLENDLKSYESLSGVINELHKKYDVQHIEFNNQQKAIVKLKVVPCGSQYPNCHYIKDAHEAKGTIKEQSKIVKELKKSLVDNQKLLNKYIKQKIKEKISTYHKTNIDLSVEVSEFKRLTDNIESKTKIISALKNNIKNSEENLRNLTKSQKLLVSEEFKKKKDYYSVVINDINLVQQNKNDCLISIGGKKDYLKNSMKEQEQGKDIIKKLKLYDSIQAAFSKNGIPVMVLKDQLPSINREVSKILDSLVDFTVSLETDMTANTMDVYIEDSINKRPIELCSGMEKTICSLALRVALGNLSSLPRPDLFILDESFGALDEDNLQKSMELLQMFRDYFKTVLIISHINEIKEIVDTIIEIKNDGFESKVEA